MSPTHVALDIDPQRDIWQPTTKLTDDFSADPFAKLKQLNAYQRQRAIDSYWRKNNHVNIGETAINVLLFTVIMWIMAFLMSLGLLVLWQ